MINSRITDLLTGEWMIVSSLNQNKALNIYIGGTDPNDVTIWDKANVPQQKWKIQWDGNKRCFIIRSVYNNKVLSRTSTISSDGVNVLVANYSTGDFTFGEQRWYLHYDCSGHYIIANYIGDYLSPDVLTIPNSELTNGNSIKTSVNSGANNQKFILVRP